MGLTPDGWFTFAERYPGPPDKVYSQPNTAQIYVPHSAVGYYPGWLSRLNSQERDAAGRYTPYAAASVHGFIMYDGKVIQHYPITASCWASGNKRANTTGIAFENEGGHDPVDEPLTAAQLASNIRIIQELSAAKGWEPKRPPGALMQDPTVTLLEHNECVELWGGSPTACPSHRIPWNAILEAIGEEDEDMFTDDDRKVVQANRMHQAVTRLLDVNAHQLDAAAATIRAGGKLKPEHRDLCIQILMKFGA